MLRDLGLTDEELEEARRQALEGMLPTMGAEQPQPPPAPAPAAKPMPAPAAPEVDAELEAARGQDRGELMGRNLAQGLHDFNAKYLSGGVPLRAMAGGPSAESQLLADRATQATKAKAKEAQMQAAALAELKRRGFALSEQQAKASEADRLADNQREDAKLGLERERFGWERDPSNPKNKPKPAGASGDARIRGSNLEGMPYGYELLPGATPSKTQREDAANVIKQRTSVTPAVEKMRQLVAAGPQRLVSPTSISEVKQTAQRIATAIRVMEGLGVPSGPDTLITLDLIGNPNSKVNEFAGVMPKLLANLDDYFNTKVEAALGTYGIKKRGDGAAQPAQAVTPDHDEAALQWAKEHPDDPRAAEILRVNGGP